MRRAEARIGGAGVRVAIVGKGWGCDVYGSKGRMSGLTNSY